MRQYYTATFDKTILGRDSWMRCKDRQLSMYVEPRDEMTERTIRTARKPMYLTGERPEINARIRAQYFEIVNIAGYESYDYQNPYLFKAGAIEGVWGRKPLPAAYSRHAETPEQVAANVVASKGAWGKQSRVDNPPF